MLRPNITEREGSCHCGDCKKVASDSFLNRVQELRDRAGRSLRFTSMVRCPGHNEEIGGAEDSAHLESAKPGPYGAVDIATTDPALRFEIFKIAWQLGFNHYEICDKHIHIGFLPAGHRLKNVINWGKSR